MSGSTRIPGIYKYTCRSSFFLPNASIRIQGPHSLIVSYVRSYTKHQVYQYTYQVLVQVYIIDCSAHDVWYIYIYAQYIIYWYSVTSKRHKFRGVSHKSQVVRYAVAKAVPGASMIYISIYIGISNSSYLSALYTSTRYRNTIRWSVIRGTEWEEMENNTAVKDYQVCT